MGLALSPHPSAYRRVLGRRGSDTKLADTAPARYTSPRGTVLHSTAPPVPVCRTGARPAAGRGMQRSPMCNTVNLDARHVRAWLRAPLTQKWDSIGCLCRVCAHTNSRCRPIIPRVHEPIVDLQFSIHLQIRYIVSPAKRSTVKCELENGVGTVIVPCTFPRVSKNRSNRESR